MELSRRNLGKLAVATGAVAAAGTGAGTALSRSADAAATWKTTGTAVSALAGFDNQMKTFMQARGITAGQLAVTYKGRLVLARGYSTSTALTVNPTSLFRVASLTKSFTAAAIVKLVQDGKLSLSTPVGNISRHHAGDRPDPGLALVDDHDVEAAAAPRRLGPRRLR